MESIQELMHSGALYNPLDEELMKEQTEALGLQYEWLARQKSLKFLDVPS